MAHLTAEVQVAENAVEVELKSPRTACLPLPSGFVSLFRLRKGLSHLGEVQVRGTWAEELPTARRRGSRPGRLPLLAGRLQSNATPRPMRVRTAALAEIHRALDGPEGIVTRQYEPKFRAVFPRYQPQQGVISTLLQHPCGLVVLAWEQWHRILGQPPALTQSEIKRLDDSLQRLFGAPLRSEMSDAETLALLTQMRPLKALRDKFDPLYAPFLERLIEEFEEIERFSDAGRLLASDVQPLVWQAPDGKRCELCTQPVTWDTLRGAGITSAAIRRVEEIRKPARPCKWFAIRCGPHRLWGENETLSVINEADPTVIYSLSAGENPQP
jgi:hypothetical protein